MLAHAATIFSPVARSGRTMDEQLAAPDLPEIN